MTSRSLQASSLSLQAPFVSGAPGPPGLRAPAYASKYEEDDDMFYGASGRGEPDDLGDLMQEMREGAPWVDGLAMDCELQLGGGFASDAPAAFACPSASPQPPPPAEAPRRAPHPEPSQLQPGMAAKLMHPGAVCGGGGGALPLAQPSHMIPNNPAPPMDFEGDSEAPGLALAPGPRCPPGSDWVPLAGAPPGSLAAFQAPPMAFYPAPGPHHMSLMHGPPPPPPHGFDAGMAAMLAGGPPGPFPLVPLPLAAAGGQAPSPSGGSGDASDTHLRLRASLDASATNDSGSNGRGGCCRRGAPPARCDRAPGAPPVPGSPLRDAPSESSDVEDPGSGGMARQLSSAQVVPDVAPAPVPVGLPPLPPWGPEAAYAAFPPLPLPFFYEPDSPAAQTARLARQRSLERYREKKARRGFAKRIRYVARKVNADRRPRVKGRFVKAGEAAAILEAEAAAGAALGSPPASAASEEARAAVAAAR